MVKSICFFYLPFLASLACFMPSGARAAAVAQRRQEVMQQAQQQAVAQQQAQVVAAYKQALAQKQAQEVAVYQQALAQRQAQAQQQAAYQKAAAEYAAYKMAMQQAVAQRQAQAQAQQVQAATQQVAQVVAYKQAVAARHAAETKAQSDVNGQIQEYARYLATRRAALVRQGVVAQATAVEQQLLQNAVVQKFKAQQARVAVETRIATEAASRAVMGKKLAADVMATKVAQSRQRTEAPAPSGDPTEVDIQDLWAALDAGSTAWGQILDREIKLLTVAEYIDRFRKARVTIRKAPGHYVGLIDSLAKQMDGFLSAPFMNVLSYAAIMEYDFDNGSSKEELARKTLGPEQFEMNRRRVLGQ